MLQPYDQYYYFQSVANQNGKMDGKIVFSLLNPSYLIRLLIIVRIGVTKYKIVSLIG